VISVSIYAICKRKWCSRFIRSILRSKACTSIDCNFENK